MKKEFSALHQTFIPCVKWVASTSFRLTDNRTSTGYFLSTDGLIYSTDRNYSMLRGGGGVTQTEFEIIWSERSSEYDEAIIK